MSVTNRIAKQALTRPAASKSNAERIVYSTSANAPTFVSRLKELAEIGRARSICDVGGGANPCLPLEYLEQRDMSYTLLDISRSELDKAPDGYLKVEADVCGDDLNLCEQFDLVHSRMVAEHVRCGMRYHRNVWRMLRPGGIAFHLFPTLFCLPFVLNRVVPDGLSDWCLGVFHPRDQFQRAKFPAYYSWCYGPTRSQLRRLKAIGYQIVEYRGCFGHGYYDKLPLVRGLHRGLSHFLARHPSPYLTSYAYLIVQKPTESH